MIDTYSMQARRRDLPSSVKFHMCMDETSGLYVTDQVSKCQYSPASVEVGDPADLGYIAFEEENAVKIVNNAEAKVTPLSHNVILNTDKVCLLAGCIKPYGTNGTRIAIGTALENNVFTISTMGGLHCYFRNTDNTDGVNVSTGALYTLTDTSSPYILYVLWDGSSTLSCKVITLDGVVYNNGSYNLSASGSGSWTSDSVQLGQTSRLTGGHYYGITCWELNHMPDQLDLKLANWGNLLVAGYKGAIDLI